MYIVCTTSPPENVHWECCDANHPIVKHNLNTWTRRVRSCLTRDAAISLANTAV